MGVSPWPNHCLWYLASHPLPFTCVSASTFSLCHKIANPIGWIPTRVAVGFRVEAEKTHFRDRNLKMKALFSAHTERQPVQNLNCILKGDLYNIFNGQKHKARVSRVGCCVDRSYFDTRG